eukprot:TRINITY_DN2273_c0_g1_i1.p1 TRINITY_DN2273_c0_g1~~TRINITY_DN2273_c0_g1_i1.p1  ORF type:complete len:311 (+),score=12.60 TRINITY_DN2273_c0_g1_i1:18-950(+)
MDNSTVLPFQDILLPYELILVEQFLTHLNYIALILCLFEVITHLIFKREFPRSMPLQLGIVTCFLHGCLLISPIVGFSELSTQTEWCYVQGVGIQYATVATSCWLLCISFHLYLTVVKRYKSHEIRRTIAPIHVFAWGFPLLVTIPPLIAKRFEDRGVWCWVSAKDFGAWEFGCFYAPVVLFLLLSAFFWFSVVIRVCRVSTQFKTISYIIQSVLIVLTFMISYGMQFVHRIYNVFEYDSFYLELVHTITLSTAGVFVFLFYGLTYDNIQLYRRLFAKCGCGRSSNTINNYSDIQYSNINYQTDNGSLSD